MLNFLNNDSINSNIQFVISGSDLMELAMLLADEVISRKEAEKAGEEESLLTRKEACEMLGITETTIWNWDKRGYLKPVRVGNRTMYRKGDVQKIMGGRRA